VENNTIKRTKRQQPELISLLAVGDEHLQVSRESYIVIESIEKENFKTISPFVIEKNHQIHNWNNKKCEKVE
jgi:hypothetical protein